MTATADKPNLSEFIKLSKRSSIKPCKVRIALESLNSKQKAQFEAACSEDTGLISNQALHLWLERHSGDRWSGNWQHAFNHRQAKCSCALDA